MPIIAALGSLVLIAVVLVKPGKKPNLAYLAGALVIAMVAVPLTIGLILGRTGAIFPDARSEQLMRSVGPILQQTANESPETVIILEGGSWSARGIDGSLLEQELSSLGLNIPIVQTTLGGANYFERDFVLNQLADDLTADQKSNLAASNVILIRELSPGYLTNPLSQVDGNLYSDRLYAYASPRRIWDMNRAAFDTAEWSPLLGLRLAQQAAFNWMRLGEARRLSTPQALEVREGYSPVDATKDGTKTNMIPSIIRFIESDEVPQFEESAWIEVLNGMGADNYGLPIDSTWWVELPTLRQTPGEFARWFASRSDNPVILIDNVELYQTFENVDLWSDSSHLRPLGAEIYTVWLASRIAELLGSQS